LVDGDVKVPATPVKRAFVVQEDDRDGTQVSLR